MAVDTFNNQKIIKTSPVGDKPSGDVDILAQYDKDFFNYKDVACQAIKDTKRDWDNEIVKTKERRDKRYFNLDIEDEKKRGTLEKDELFTPVAIVNTNILREQAKYAAYLTKSARSCIFSCNEDSSIDPTILERDFTQKCRYNAWEIDFLRWIDGCETHAWDIVEVIFDSSKPGHFGVEHCGHENVYFPADTKDFQQAPYVIRMIDYTAKDLIDFVKKRGWNKDQVAKVLSGGNNKKTDNKNNSLFRIEKVSFRGDDDFIYVGWSCSEFCDDWLREPKRLFLGKVVKNLDGTFTQLFETSYPLEPFIYQISENQVLMELKGRVDLDEHKQEAATSLMSSFVTSHRRAAEPYFATETGNGTEVEEAQSGIKIRTGEVFKVPVKQFQLKPADAMVMTVINTLIGQSQMESGDVNYAVQSNKSTRKTAAEVNLAKSESDLLTSVQVTLLSIALRNVYTRCFDIYIMRVKAGLITVTNPVAELINNYTWTLKPAGDIDVIERNQKITLMQQAWQVYQNTPAAQAFLINLTKLLFPDEAQQYIQQFQIADVEAQKDDLLMEAAQFIYKVVIDPMTNRLKPEFAALIPTLQNLQLKMQSVMQNSQRLMSNKTAEPGADTQLNTPDSIADLESQAKPMMIGNG
jgi:hypothetical protein